MAHHIHKCIQADLTFTDLCMTILMTATDYDNADSMLPVEEGVTYQQCSLDDAGKQKLIFTQDAKRIYYTDDDGQSFDEIY